MRLDDNVGPNDKFGCTLTPDEMLRHLQTVVDAYKKHQRNKKPVDGAASRLQIGLTGYLLDGMGNYIRRLKEAGEFNQKVQVSPLDEIHPFFWLLATPKVQMLVAIDPSLPNGDAPNSQAEAEAALNAVKDAFMVIAEQVRLAKITWVGGETPEDSGAYFDLSAVPGQSEV